MHEIIKLRNLNFKPSKRHLERDRAIHLLRIYTGYYYKDLQMFLKTDLVKDPHHGGLILGKWSKNDNPTIVPLFKFPQAKNLIEKYKSHDDCPYVLALSIFIVEPVYNHHLKEIAGLAKIPRKKAPNKVARHTNAQLWMHFLDKKTLVAKMLGHKKEETTNSQFEIDVSEIIEGTKGVNFKEMGI